ncbi:MAG: hypothetical protein GY731_05575, partial [Gammaproteobacteria bacterium]|nr:hypothetical protein [Gammaproteobacteria bacterium]
HHLLYGSDIGPFPTRDATVAAAAQLIGQIEADPGLRFTVIDLTTLDANSLKNKAFLESNEGLVYRYALKHLNPFAITGDPGIYVQHNAAHELDIHNTATGEGAMTERYIEDRALFLATKIELARQDRTENWTDIRFEDKASSFVIEGSDAWGNREYYFGDEHKDEETGSKKADSLYGGGGDDVLRGWDGEDYLEGNDGDDKLYGRTFSDDKEDTDKDTLVGGKGFDRYYAGAGDTIIDDYGEGKAKGQVYFDNTPLFGGIKKPGESAWSTLDNKFTYTLEDTTLTVEGPSGTLTIKDYHKDKEDLNIELKNEPGPTLTLTDEDDTAKGEFVDDGNVTHDFADYDGVEGLGGNDIISADDNHPGFVIKGGDGDDSL